MLVLPLQQLRCPQRIRLVCLPLQHRILRPKQLAKSGLAPPAAQVNEPPANLLTIMNKNDIWLTTMHKLLAMVNNP